MSEADPDLPGCITSITPQKKNKKRYSIFVEGEFLIGVAGETLLEHNLRKGDEVTVQLFRKLQRAEGRHAVKSYLLGLLARRDHARRELYRKARRKDHPDDVINDVLDELERKDLINEEAFAGKFARDKSRLNSWGPSKIKAHLAKKGIDKDVRGRIVAQTFEDVDLKTRFKTLVEKKRQRFLREEDTFKRKKKVFDYLQRKGYYSGSIYRHLDDLMRMLKNE